MPQNNQYGDVTEQCKGLEEMVNERTIELSRLNEELQREVSERKRAETQLEHRTHLLSILLDVSNLVSSTLEIKPLFEAILDRLKKIIDYRGAKIFAIEGEFLRVIAHRSQLTDEEASNYSFSVVNIPLGQEIIIEKRAVLIPDVLGDTQLALEFRSALSSNFATTIKHIRSWIGIPLMVKNKVVGALTIDHDEPGFYLPHHVELGTIFANQVAIEFENARLYLENARLYQEERLRHLEDEQRRHVAEGLRDILSILNSNRPIAEILDFIINQAVRVMGTDTGAIYRLQGGQNVLKIEAAVGLPEEYITEMSIPLGMGVVGRAVVERKPIYVSDMIELIPSYFNGNIALEKPLSWLAAHYHGLLAVPLVCKDEVYGGIVLYYHQIRNFTKDVIELAMTFADQVALALDNAKLRAQTEEMAVASERSRLARDLHDAVTQTLFSASLIAEVLPKIWQRNPDEGRKRIEEIRQLTRGALAEMRTLLLELRPAALVESGLRELLNQLTQAVTGRSRIPITLNIEGRLLLPADVKIALYRIVQEALNNISKHSGANHVDLSVKTAESNSIESDWAELRISDNGRGFEMQGISPEHLGLGIMRERAEAVNAEIYIESQIGKGTIVFVSWAKEE